MHKLGRKRYESGDESRNSVILALVTLGEGWHNNHHALPSSARHGMLTREPDLTWWILKALEATGLASDVRQPERKRLEEMMSVGHTGRNSVSFDEAEGSSGNLVSRGDR